MYYKCYKIQSTANRKEFVTILRYRTTNGGIHIPRLFSSKIIFEVLERVSLVDLYVGYLHSLAVRTGIGKKLLVRDLARELVFFSIPKYKFLSSREVNERLLESDSSRAIEN